MNCPKCGVVAAAGAEECAACGVVFSRWRERPLRPSLSNTPLPSAPPAPVEQQRIPAPLIIAGVIVFVVVGLLWTAHRRAARASEPGDVTAMLDDINNKGQAERDRRRNEAAKGLRAEEHERAQAAAAAAKAASQLPPTITEADVRALIERDAFFQENVLMSVPKAFDAPQYPSVAQKYPALPGALHEELIEFEPPFDPKFPHVNPQQIQVHVPSTAFYKVAMINDRADTYEIDVGRRRLDALTVESAGDFKIEAGFSYTYEHAVGKALLPQMKRSGHASLTRGAEGWRIDLLTHS